MAMRINQDACTRCGKCRVVCPNDGIIDYAGMFVVDSENCTECFGISRPSRCLFVCPSDALERDRTFPLDIHVLGLKAFMLRPDLFPQD